ncbi:alpha/beta fold hydrolase [Sinirhodobacter sp. HNIBRBA609]|nr:alpha/beta fold hydrolase [Sinirhodobacter sp. HNIBRBA609]
MNIATDYTSRDALKLLNKFAEPANDLEREIAETFSDIMKVHPVGSEDDFYDLGGDSLMAEQISMELQRKTGRNFAMSSLFTFPTPRLIAGHLSKGGLPETFERPPIFVVHGRGGYTVPRPEFHQGLEAGSRLVMFELPGIRGQGPFPRDVTSVAQSYVAQIQREYPEGPILLAAFCAGGLIALEMAAQLRKAGREIAGLVLLDPSIPARVRKRFRLGRRIEKNPTDRAARLRYGLLYGTPDGQSTASSRMVEYLELRLRLIACVIKEHWLGKLKQQGVFWKHRTAGLRVLPRAWLIVAYRFAWPEPYSGRVHIIASQDRAQEFGRDGSIWSYLLPDRHVEIMADTHSDIGHANAAEVSARMERVLLGALA